MATLFVRHDVADFDRWKEAYEAFRPVQKEMGVLAEGVYCAEGNANDVTVYHEFGTMDEARAFVSSDRLRAAMVEAGVQGEPTIWFANKV